MRTIPAHRLAPAAPDEEYVFGACAPDWHSAADRETVLTDWIRSVRDCGIERVCCLLSGSGVAEDGSHLDRYAEAFGEANVLHAPIPHGRLADEDTLNESILPFLADARAAEDRTVVHCLTGVGRTGQVLAAWLVYNRDYGPDRAVETVQGMGRDPTAAVERGDAEREDLRSLLSSVVQQ